MVKRITLTLTDELHDKLVQAAEQDDRKPAVMARRIIADNLESDHVHLYGEERFCRDCVLNKQNIERWR